MNYFGIYNTSGDVQTALSAGTLNKPYVAIVGDEIDYDSQVNEIDYTQIPLTFEFLSAGTLTIQPGSCYYSHNGGEWIEADPESETEIEVSVASGDTVAFKSADGGFVGAAKPDVPFNAYGNPMSVVLTGYDQDFTEVLDFSGGYTLGSLFNYDGEGCAIVSAENLVLPATALTDSCYEYMFAECHELRLPPKSFPLADLSNISEYGPYSHMFEGTIRLERIPQLPAYSAACKYMYAYMFSNYYEEEGVEDALSAVPADCLSSIATLEQGCFSYMFSGRKNLVNAPVLPAATLVEGCYGGMFDSCANITGVTMLATSIEQDANPFGGCGESESWVDSTGWYEGGDDKVLYVNPNSTIEFEVYPEDDSQTECTPTLLPYRWTIENYTA